MFQTSLCCQDEGYQRGVEKGLKGQEVQMGFLKKMKHQVRDQKASLDQDRETRSIRVHLRPFLFKKGGKKKEKTKKKKQKQKQF